MAITDLASDAATRAQLVERLHERVCALSAESDASLPGLSNEMRDLVDRLDRVDLETVRVSQVEDDARTMRPVSSKIALGGLAVSAGAVVAGLLGVPGIDCAITGVFGALLAGGAALARHGHSQNIAWSGRQRAAQEAKRADLRSQLDGLCSQARPAIDGRLLDEMRKSGATASSPQEAQAGHLGMLLLNQVERDPSVLVAAQRLKKIEDLASHASTALAGDREALFAAEPARMEATWTEKSTPGNALMLGGLLGSGIGLGVAAGALFAPAAAWPVGLVAAVASLPLTRMLARSLTERGMEKAMRREMTAELGAAQAETRVRRNDLEKAQEEAVTHYTAVACSRALPVAPTAQPSGTVAAGDGFVTVGGVRVNVKKSKA